MTRLSSVFGSLAAPFSEALVFGSSSCGGEPSCMPGCARACLCLGAQPAQPRSASLDPGVPPPPHVVTEGTARHSKGQKQPQTLQAPERTTKAQNAGGACWPHGTPGGPQGCKFNVGLWARQGPRDGKGAGLATHKLPTLCPPTLGPRIPQ